MFYNKPILCLIINIDFEQFSLKHIQYPQYNQGFLKLCFAFPCMVWYFYLFESMAIERPDDWVIRFSAVK